MVHTVKSARWFNHSRAVQPNAALQKWLCDPGSMTYKLTARCHQFDVQCVWQGNARGLTDEYTALGMAQRSRVIERDVFLRCDGQAVVFGHTVLQAETAASHWHFFGGLGNAPLGATLFVDPLVKRGRLQFARLHTEHPLVQRICRGLGLTGFAHSLYARRSLFYRKDGVMLVTDIFLPAIGKLIAK